jgi:hypothetical protein
MKTLLKALLLAFVGLTGAAQSANADQAADQQAYDSAKKTLQTDLANFASDPTITSAKIDADRQAVIAAQKAVLNDQLNVDLSPADYGCFNLNGVYDGACIVTGALAIPFRAQLSGQHDVNPGISGDAFFGVNFTPFGAGGFSMTPLVYVGYLPTLSSTNASSGSPGSNSNGSTSGALDTGLGIAFPVTTGFNPSSSTKPHIGFVIGTDVTGSNKYAYNGKLYASVLIGFNF